MDEHDEFTGKYLAQLPVLRGLVKRILRYHPPEEIQDVLQDVWVKGAVAYAKYDVPHFKAWIGRIAINVAINRIRRFRKEPLPEIINDNRMPRQLAAPDPKPEQAVLRRELRAAMADLNARAPGMAEAVALIYLAGCTHQESAGILGVAEGTIKSQAHKGLGRLCITLTARKAA